MDADAVTLMVRAADAIEPAMRAVQPGQLSMPTPCAGWDLRALLDHLLGEMRSWAERIEGREPEAAPPVLAAAGDDAAVAWQRSRDALFVAVSEPGALEREIPLPGGRRGSAQFLAAILPIELMLHGWDAARSIGASTDLDPELAAAMLHRGRQLMEGRPRGSEMAFGEEQAAPPDATFADQLAAFYGRRV